MTMARDLTQIGVKFDAQLWQAFREDVQARKGGIDGHLRVELEQALREYLNASEGGDTHDRLNRIEDRLDTIADALADEDKKKKDSEVTSRTEKKLNAIRQQIQEETDGSPKVHEKVVELAIRDNAGSSEPTIRRYKQLLKQDNDLFTHPTHESMYFRDPEEFVLAVNAMRKGGKITADTYGDVVAEYGEDWWLAQQEEQNDQPKGFQ